MHPEIQQSTPGKCPKCGMALVKKAIKTKAPAAKPKPKPKTPTKPKTPAADPHAGHGLKPETTNAAPPLPAKTDEAHVHHQSGHQEQVVGVIKAPPPRVVRYDLYVADTMVPKIGSKGMRHAIAINGSIPAPTLYFNEGDTAEIWVHNKMHHETSIHWHGLILPNTEDGVPYLTTAPVKPHGSHRFYFPIVQSGTYWYHSHTMNQEQDGMYGMFIINKREEPAYKQLPIILTDWSDYQGDEIERSLHNQTDWFAIKKGSVQSYGEAISAGHFKTKLLNEWKRMLAMDVSDVYYDRFYINGKSSNEQPQYKAGDKIRLRVVNGSSSTYYWLTWAGGKMTVIASDGEDVEPVEVDRLIVGVAETYDILVTIPDDNHSYEFLATPEDRTKSASLWLGSGSKVIAPHLPKLKYFEGMKMMNAMMKMNGDMEPMAGMTNQVMDMNTVMYPEITGGTDDTYGNTVSDSSAEETTEVIPSHNDNAHAGHDMSAMAGHDMQSGDTTDHSGMQGGYVDGKWQDMNSGPNGIKTLNYGMLRAPQKTTLPNWPTRTIHFELTGNMNRYVWSMDGKTVSETDVIKIRKGENIRMVITNNTMMRHPMHLHGHYFRVLNENGEYSPLKNVLDIMPMETDTIEFAATESGDWFFHCHILYHMMAGMGRIFSYENSPINPQVPDRRYALKKVFEDDRKFYLKANVGLETNGSDGEITYANTRWIAGTEWRLGLKPEYGYESETYVGRYFGKMQWLLPFVGFDYHYNNRENDNERNLFGQTSNQNNRRTIMGGVRYTLPMLVTAEARVDGLGKFRFQLEREDIPVTSRLRLNLMANTDKEYMVGLRYAVGKYWSLSTHYDSDMGLGAGLTITY
ncbi:MAG: copper oxidase [Bacteroidetes bacterium 46-16]|nr:MAG: copper oxidase [Bacteroidetes bacterium 46-16]